jgi:hypothetical protein
MSNKNTLLLIYAANAVLLLATVGIAVFAPSPAKDILLDVFPILFALLAAAITYRIYQSVAPQSQARKLWLLMFLAMSAWLVAEVLWLSYGLQGLESYPSWADLFYIAGDVLLAAFFVLQVNFLRVFIDGKKRWIAIGALAVFVLVALAFVYLPILTNASGASFWEVALPFIYETLYLILLLGATNLALASWDGLLGKRWLVILIGIWLYAFTNQIFFFAEWNGLYRSENQFDWLSILFDILYILSYQVLTTGFYLRHFFPYPQVNLENILISFRQPERQQFWVLLSDNAGRTLFVDPRLASFLTQKEIGSLVGEPVCNILSLPNDTQQKILLELQGQKSSSGPSKVVLGREIYALFAVSDEKEKGQGDIYWIAIPWQMGKDLKATDIPSPEKLLAAAMRGIPAPYSPSIGQKIYLNSALPFLTLLAAQYGGSEVAQEFTRQFSQADPLCEADNPPSAPTTAEPCRQMLFNALERLLVLAPSAQIEASLSSLHSALGTEIVAAAREGGLLLDVSAVAKSGKSAM